jgi:hypothetical protein
MRRLLLSLLLAVGCSSGDDATLSQCVPGASQACACTDGRTGAQSCNAGGTFDACVCTGSKTDASVDTGDLDASTDTAAPLCDEDLSSDFMCALPTKRATPTKDCTEDQLQAMVTACIADPISKTPASCSPWKAANGACATCVGAFAATYYAARVIPERNQCYWALMDDSCDKALNCSFDCQDNVCTTSDTTLGTGADGKTSAYRDCAVRARSNAVGSKPKGRCWDIASKAANDCLAATDVTPCILDELGNSTPDIPTLKGQVVEYLRGACRDGGDWSNRTSPTPKGADAGTSDAATSDSASSDAASDGG